MNEAEGALRKTIGLGSLFMLGFGTIIGVAWLTVLGSWLAQAGSMGAILAFAIGGGAMLIIGLCYAEVATMFPFSGGQVAYILEIYGTRTAFAAGWSLAFNYIVITAFEAISVGWVVAVLFPAAKGPVLYSFLGNDVHAWSMLLGLALMAAITYINYRGARSTTRFQDLFTAILLAASAAFIAGGLYFGDTDNLHSLFVKSDVPADWAYIGILTVLISTPFWYTGFDTIPQAMGELRTTAALRLVPRVITLSIFAALIFYCLIILTAAMSMPRDELLGAELPVAAAIEASMQSHFFGKLVLFAGLCGLITTWNAVFFAATRLLYALGRGQMIPPAFARVHRKFGSPAVAVIFVGLVGGLTSLLGRSAILVIANASSTLLSLLFFLICIGVVRLRKTLPAHPRPYRVPAGNALPYLGAAAALGMLLLSLYEPLRDSEGGIPVVWVMLLIWAILGTGFWFAASGYRLGIDDQERKRRIAQ